MKVQGDSSELEISSSPSPSKMAVTSAAPPEAVAHHEGSGGGEVIEMEVDGNSIEGEAKGGSSEVDKNNTINFGGNRWPRQETLALLKIRSDMDAVFRDSSLKGPLWEEISRKLANLGYQRSAKKCKEKFENVYKYHKRTKESRSGKSEGKHYKFFDQLQALENHQFPLVSSYPQKLPPQPVLATTTTNNPLVTLPTRPSDDSATTTTITQVPISFPSTNPTTTPLISPSPPITNPKQTNNNNSLPNMNHLFTTLISTTSNSSTASDEDLEEKRYLKKKRKWKKDYFRRLTREVLAKQEEMQKKFLEDLDKRERERAAQHDAWRIQEMTRINREHEILVQERSTAAAKDATVIALLQKLSGQQQTQLPQQTSQIESPQKQIQLPQQQPVMQNNNLEIQKIITSNGDHSNSDANIASSSSRWPKAEVHALIRIRTSLESNYHENGAKAALWEEISSLMKKNGYNRSAKRCKEKWENINKYFKKVKESNKQRRPDSKTCPYFEELDAIYKEKSKNSSFQNLKPNNEMMVPLMVQPEQQWRPPTTHHHDAEGIAKQNTLASHQYQEKEEELEDEEDDEESLEDESDSRYEIETNNKLISSMDTVE